MQAANIPSTPATIALVDFSNLLVRNYKAMANDAGPNDAGQVTLNQIAEIRQMCETVVVCMDSPPYLRKTIYPEYKGKRERDEQLEVVRAWTVERLKKDGYQIARSPGHEADDVIAMLASEYPNYGCHDVRVFGNDKDACQLVSDIVRIFVPKGRGEYEIRDVAWVKQKYGVEPKDMALFQAICGDKSDGIPGIAGIGDKGAAKLITQFKDPAGMATACTRAVEESKKEGAKPLAAFWRNYAAGMASLPKWILLTTLNTRCKTERLPLDYLERLEPQPLVEEDELSDDLGDDPTDEVDWEFIAEATAAKEREELAKALPVEPASRPLVSEPMEDGPARRARQAAESDKHMPMPPKHDPSRMIVGKDPKADEALRELAAKTAPAASSGSTSASMPPVASAPSAPTVTKSEPGGTQPAPSGAGTSASPQPAATQNDGAPSGSYLLTDAERELCRTTLVYRAPELLSPRERRLVELWSAEREKAAPAAQVVPPTQGPPKPQREATHIELVAPPNWALATQPRSASEVFSIAKHLHNSKRFLDKHPMHEMLAAVILRGRELGLGMMTSIDAFHVIRGKVCASSQLISALAERDPNHEYSMVVELDEQHALVEIKHRKQPKPVQWSYTIEEADRIGLLAPSPRTNEPSMWVKRPKTMLAKTAQAIGHRFMFPSATLGLHALETEPEGQAHLDD
jgi:5'-3' exonuclease